MADRRELGPYGLQGGESGKAGTNAIIRGANGANDCSEGFTRIKSRGSKFELKPPGGGGWGKE
jgi:N-methylhydantoinase B/oxoprolinase/acetone carboxylase alpha subunit